ncbi:hypothetical protein LF887_15520 [Chryseobacterium sp. MEBOG06]|uniref:PKD domain-containing protein n=1 Tax=Chryseobacterium sp. MEBOG06 TaxID=2879938 RepID=UPI001F447EE3|nr:hypothetical protein [Chryseobacterium sp. MEBOG06]UKB82413.1 hypothetical protein LF887_15520 [Chryseobacterium sp. MEBOG06]
MNNQLSNIAVQYRKFSKGQYIEYTQFNEFLDFFEDQDRLSRVMLQGVGVVCGFKPKLIYTNKLLNSIQLSQGTAITTDGDLLTLSNTSEVSKELYISDLKTINIENKDYTHFKVYDNFKVNYPAFYDKDIHQIDLWELATDQDASSDFQPVSNLSNVEDKYLLLYLEDYERDVKPCRGVDCDNHGVQQIRNLKVLVTTAKGISNMIGEDLISIPGVTQPVRKDLMQRHPLFIDDILKPARQERVIVERLILNNNSEKQFSVSNLRDLYINALDKYGYGEPLFKKIEAISRIMGTSTAYYPAFKNTIDKFLSQQSGFQYAYDVVKDLADTYSEIIKLLPKAFTKDLPDLPSFPKHIMLGKLTPGRQLDFSRHQFYNSPVLDDDKATQRVKVLIERFVQQAANFKYSDDIEIEIGTGAEIKPGIKIIPSQKLNPLSNKAIPFYYKIYDNFLKVWNFDKTSNRSFKDNLGYDTGLLSSEAHIKEPLNFDIDKNSFYNIEGHQGMNYQSAFDQIRQIRDQQQLGFDIMLLSLDKLVNNKDLSKAYFNEYVEKNPGLEHKGGVERGGTFVMVYANIGKYTAVIADFSLPYICCTPKTEVKLSLPSTVICAEAHPVPFTVIPVNGEVKANVNADLNGGVEITNGQYFFNPKNVHQSLRGKEISFTVNGKPTNCSIKVITQPEVEIKVDHVFYPEKGSVATTVNMLVTGEHFKDYTYSWDFWDNGSFIPLKPDEDGNVNYTYYNLVPTRIPTIKVKVNGSGCTQDIAVRDWHDAPVQLSLPKNVICSTSPSIPFTVSPAGGIVEADIGNGVEIVNGKYVFNPQKVDESLHNKIINFTVDSKSTVCSIKVITQPAVTVGIQSVDFPNGDPTQATVNFIVSGPGFTNYTYSVNGSTDPLKPGTDGKMSYKLKNLDPKGNPAIDIVASNGICTQTITINNWYKPPTVPTVVIKDIDFSRGVNCCEIALPAIKADAGKDQYFSLSNGSSFELAGVGEGAKNLTYSWLQISGSTQALLTFEPNKPNVKISNLTYDTYQLRFIVFDADSDAFDFDEVAIVVDK